MPESGYSPCQICTKNNWQVLATRTFSKADTEILDNMNKKIYLFMFEVWFPGESELEFKNLYCTNCGFVCFWPRPSVDDLDSLRRRNSEPMVGYLPGTDPKIAHDRSQHLYNYLAKHYNLNEVRKILDYGGSDGNLMEAFLSKGKDCYLIDYCPFSMPGVTRIGETVYDINPHDKFDLIICNHVIEHVAAPVETLKILLNHLSETGILFVEVPMELWKRPPLLTQRNPITHVNFFSPHSLKSLFTVSGASVLTCGLGEYMHTTSSWNPGIRCIGQRTTKSPERFKPDSLEFLNPNMKSYIRYYLGNPRKFKSEITRKLKLSM